MSDTTAQTNGLASCHSKPFPRSSVAGAQAYLLGFATCLVFAVALASFIGTL